MVAGAGVAAAQEFRGTIEGTVTDSTGGVLPGRDRHRHEHGYGRSAGRRHRRRADDTASCISIPAATRVAAELSGFKKFVRVQTPRCGSAM